MGRNKVFLKVILLASLCILCLQTTVRAETIGANGEEMRGGSLTDTNRVYWIDHIELPKEAKDLYDKLVEGSDNDGVDDFLIEDKYFSGDKKIYVTTLKGRAKSQSEVYEEIREEALAYTDYIDWVFDAFLSDYPEVFWLIDRYIVYYPNSIKTTEQGWEYSVDLFCLIKSEEDNLDTRIEEYRSESSIKADIEVRDAKVQEILSLVEGKSDYEKLLIFNDILVSENEYNTLVSEDSEAIHSISEKCRRSISALKGSTGTDGPVCSAYAEAFKVLCDAAGIPCVSIIGDAKSHKDHETGRHQWNYVMLEDNWYAVDVTWGDEKDYEWFLVGSDTLIRDMKFIESHVPDDKYYKTEVINAQILSKEKYVLKVPPEIELVSIGTEKEQTDRFMYGDTIQVKLKVTSPEVIEEIAGNLVFYLGDKKIDIDNLYFTDNTEDDFYMQECEFTYESYGNQVS